MKSLVNHCFDMKFRRYQNNQTNLMLRATADQVAARLNVIAQKEGLDLKPNVISNLVASTQADIRQIINILSTYRLSNSTMTYDESKSL